MYVILIIVGLLNSRAKHFMYNEFKSFRMKCEETGLFKINNYNFEFKLVSTDINFQFATKKWFRIVSKGCALAEEQLTIEEVLELVSEDIRTKIIFNIVLFR